MKKIINGKVYNTDSAEFVGACSENVGTFQHLSEALYLKRTGEFFLHGCGGPMTKYAVRIDSNNWSGGDQIIPLDYDGARSWAEENLSADIYEEYFGEVAEDDSRTVISASMASSSVEIARRAAAEKGLSLSAYLESLILNQ